MRIIYYIFTFQCGHISIIIQEKNEFVNRKYIYYIGEKIVDLNRELRYNEGKTKTR